MIMELKLNYPDGTRPPLEGGPVRTHCRLRLRLLLARDSTIARSCHSGRYIMMIETGQDFPIISSHLPPSPSLESPMLIYSNQPERLLTTASSSASPTILGCGLPTGSARGISARAGAG
jgi:hypothetical protein